MGRKRVDTMRPTERRERVWALIRRAGRFCVRDIYLETGLSRDSIRDYIVGLEAAGYLTREKAARVGEPDMFTLVRDVGIEAPRVRRDGTEVTAGRGREQMWRTMKILGEFSASDVAVNASTENHPVKCAEAKTYLHFLCKAGYLSLSVPGKPGGRKTPGKPARYRFIKSRNTGPRPPMVQRIKQVYDPNLKKVMWQSGGDDDDR